MVVHVTGGSEDPEDTSAAAAVFTNNREVTPFEFTKEWRNDSDEVVNSWRENVAITVLVQRKIGPNGASENVGTYTITKITDGFSIVASDGAPTLTNTVGTFTFKMEGLPKEGTIGASSGQYIYYATEPDPVPDYKEASYSNPSGTEGSVIWTPSDKFAVNGGKIINRPVESYELPNTGGPGTSLIYLLGIALIVLAGGGYMLKTKKLLIAGSKNGHGRKGGDPMG